MTNEKTDYSHIAIKASKKSGLAECIEKSFEAVDNNSVLPFERKRQLIYSLLTFRCVFDRELIDNPSPIFALYNLTKGKKLPEKLELYDLINVVISLDNATKELLALWYITTAFVILLEPPMDVVIFENIKKHLHIKAIFNAVLNMSYSIEIPCSIEELQAQDGIPRLLESWYAPYIDYILDENELEQTNAEVRFIEWLKNSKFNSVLVGSDRMLNSYPFDEGILVCNLASRSSLEGLVKVEERIKFLTDCITMIDEALKWARKKQCFLYYYKGLFNLGKGDKDMAKASFVAALEVNKEFKLAKEMLEKI